MGGHVGLRLHCDVPHNGGHRPAPADVSFRRSAAKIITAICAGAVLDVMHIGNMKKALAGDEIMHVRDYFREKLHKER